MTTPNHQPRCIQLSLALSTYIDRTGEYQSFPGICLMDTFELAEAKQTQLFTEANTQRAERQKQAPIFVVIGNPPYNQKQAEEAGHNQNRRYKTVDHWIAESYGKKSRAKNKQALGDPYVRAFCWATHRIGKEGIVAFVSNNGFLTDIAFDGMREDLRNSLHAIYVLDLGGNVRKNPKLSGTTHNVFGIQVGVSITVLIKRARPTSSGASIHYLAVDEYWRREDKYRFLDENASITNVATQLLEPDHLNNWITKDLKADYPTFSSLVGSVQNSGIFGTTSMGIQTGRDAWAVNFERTEVENNMRSHVDTYNTCATQWKLAQEEYKKGKRGEPNIEKFIVDEPGKIKWSSRLRECFSRGQLAGFDKKKIRPCMYRPYTRQYLYFDAVMTHRRAKFAELFPEPDSPNLLICLSGLGHDQFICLAADSIPEVKFSNSANGLTQCFPFYTYAEDGTNRRENITDWALEQFRSHYHDPSITKWDIFHYIYAVLHHPEYRERYADNLNRELPRIPFAPDFRRLRRGRQEARRTARPLRKATRISPH